MIEKIQDYLKIKIGRDKAYYVTCFIYTFSMLSIMCILSYLFNNWWFAIIGSIVMNLLRAYTYGFHMKTLGGCIVVTNIMFIIFGYISKRCPLWMSFLLCTFCIRDIYLKSPLELNFEDKDIKWHRERLNKLLIILMILCLISLYFNLTIFIECILWSIIMVDIILFKNIDTTKEA